MTKQEKETKEKVADTLHLLHLSYPSTHALRSLIDSPNLRSIQLARSVLVECQAIRLSPSRIVASSEGGIAICFVSGNLYCDIECFNTGVILGVCSNRKDRPNVWEIEPNTSEIEKAVGQIRKFLNPPYSFKIIDKWKRNK